MTLMGLHRPASPVRVRRPWRTTTQNHVIHYHHHPIGTLAVLLSPPPLSFYPVSPHTTPHPQPSDLGPLVAL